MSDHIDRAAKAIHNACTISPALAREAARALDAAGLLATLEPNKVEHTDQARRVADGDQSRLERLRQAYDEVCNKIDRVDRDDPRFVELHRKDDSLLDQIHALS